MTPEQRSALLNLFQENKSREEVADALGLSEDAVAFFYDGGKEYYQSVCKNCGHAITQP